MLEPDNADVDNNNANKNNKATSFEFVSFSGNDNYKNELDFVEGNYGHEVTQHELNSVILADSIACISSMEKILYKDSSKILKGNRPPKYYLKVDHLTVSKLHKDMRRLLEVADDIFIFAQRFDMYSKDSFRHHPFHWQKTTMLRVVAQLRYLANETINLHTKKISSALDDCYDPEYGQDMSCSDEVVEERVIPPEQLTSEQVISTAKHVKYSLLPSFRDIRRTIHKIMMTNVSQFGYYSKTHASDIAMSYRRGSRERGYVISELAKNGCIPNKQQLYEVINTREKGLMFVEEEWDTRKGRKRYYEHVLDCTTEDEQEEFVGRFMIAVIPVQTKHCFDLPHYFQHDIPIDDLLKSYSIPRPMDIGEHLESVKGLRLYFSTLQFPTPDDPKDADNCTSFKALIQYIEYASEKGGSPVVCRSYKPGVKKFVCKHSKDCKYSFQLKWDDYGYYIHLYNQTSSQFVGSARHNHNRVSACPSLKFGCCYCKQTFRILNDAIEHEESCPILNEEKTYGYWGNQDSLVRKRKKRNEESNMLPETTDFLPTGKIVPLHKCTKQDKAAYR